MSIEYVSQIRVPSSDDASTDAGPSLTFGDPGSLKEGDLLLVLLNVRTDPEAWSVSAAGGQTWTDDGEFESTSGLACSNIFHAFYNGTWSNVTFTVAAATTGVIGWLIGLRGVDRNIPTNPFDTAPVGANNASSTSFVVSDFSTVTPGAWAFVASASQDDNTWTVNNSFVAPSGSGNIYWRSASGSDSSLAIARKEIAVPGAVGATTLTQATLGGDPGLKWSFAIRPQVRPLPSRISPMVPLIPQ